MLKRHAEPPWVEGEEDVQNPCYECGGPAQFTEIESPNLAYCIDCLREMYPAKKG